MTEVVLTNATVLTLEAAGPTQSAIAIKDGRIRAVGSAEDLTASALPGTSVVDLAGLTICPGFIDTHQHTSFAAFEPLQIDCSTPPLETLADVLATIATAMAREPRGRWVRAWGFNAGKVPEARNPTRGELDQVAPDNPLLLVDLSYHAGYVNSAGLRQLGIDRNTPNPGHGEIVRGRRGEPTGELLEGGLDEAQLQSWRSLVQRSPEDAVGILEHYLHRALSLGITGVGDALVLPDAAALYQRAASENRLPITVHQLFGGDTFFGRPAVNPGMVAEESGPKLRAGAMKLFMDKVHPDGPAITCVDAAGRVNESGSTYYGPEDVEDLARRAVEAGVVPAIHAIGNRAIEQVLAAYAAIRRSAPRREARLRLEHFSLGTVEQTRRAAELGVIVSTQPILAYSWGDAFMSWRRGDRSLRVLPLRSLTDAGVIVAGGSDYPCDKLPPLLGMWAAVARRSETGAEVDPDEGVTPIEALRMYTVNAAIASGCEDEEGTIRAGKRANLVVLDHNPLTSSVEQLRDIGVVQTYVDGECVFDRAAVGT
jgi:predicted amidohydrolase YtcJ